MSAQKWEWTASMVAAGGMIWFVHEITINLSLHRLYNVIPPTGGPTEIIGFSVLLWLHAKHQRFLAKQPAKALTARI